MSKEGRAVCFSKIYRKRIDNKQQKSIAAKEIKRVVINSILTL
jgi:hypothetical protein